MFKHYKKLLALILLLPLHVDATPVVYRFEGLLTGEMLIFLSSVSLIDTPFQVSIYGDTDNAFFAGNFAGAGRGYASNSYYATWEVQGLGITASENAQVYSLPGLGRIGFAWNGQYLPFGNSLPQTSIYFNSNEIGQDTNYGRLASIVNPISVALGTSLQNTPGVLPAYTTSIYFEGVGSLTLKNLADVSYSVVPVPLPSAFPLMLIATLGLFSTRRSSAV